MVSQLQLIEHMMQHNPQHVSSIHILRQQELLGIRSYDFSWRIFHQSFYFFFTLSSILSTSKIISSHKLLIHFIWHRDNITILISTNKSNLFAWIARSYQWSSFLLGNINQRLIMCFKSFYLKVLKQQFLFLIYVFSK